MQTHHEKTQQKEEMSLTKETKKIIKNREGYRCESNVLGKYHGPQPLFETLYSEVVELGNTHIAKDVCKSLNIKGIDACTLTDEGIDEQGCDPEILRELVEKVKKKTSLKNPKALWLATKPWAKKRYCHGAEPKKYRLSKKTIILSDLGPDGALILDKKW